MCPLAVVGVGVLGADAPAHGGGVVSRAVPTAHVQRTGPTGARHRPGADADPEPTPAATTTPDSRHRRPTDAALHARSDPSAPPTSVLVRTLLLRVQQHHTLPLAVETDDAPATPVGLAPEQTHPLAPPPHPPRRRTLTQPDPPTPVVQQRLRLPPRTLARPHVTPGHPPARDRPTLLGILDLGLDLQVGVGVCGVPDADAGQEQLVRGVSRG